MPKGLKNIRFSFVEKHLTHFAGMVIFHAFCGKIEIKRLFQRYVRFSQRNTHYHFSDLILTIIYTLVAGIGRLTNSRILKYNGSFQRLVGIPSFPNPTSLQRFLKRVPTQVIRQIVRVHDLLRQKIFIHSEGRLTSLLWDIDSTVLIVYGHLQGSMVGYNPQKPGRRSYHPLLCIESHTRTFWHVSFRPGNVYTSAGIVKFMNQCLAKVPKTIFRIRIRGDSGFFKDNFLRFIEEKDIGYIIVARLTPKIKAKIYAGYLRFQKGKHGREFAEFYLQLHGWERPRRFIVMRQPLPEEEPEPLQLTLWKLKRYAYHVFVTNLSLTPKRAWYFYCSRASIEGEIKELKRDFALNKIPTEHFLANLLYFHLQVLAFNLVSWFIYLCLPREYHSWTLQTLRLNLLVLPGKLVKSGSKNVLRLPENYEYQNLFGYALSKIKRLKIM